MSTSTVDVQARPEAGTTAARPPVVNDFAVVVATVNGSGSSSANGALLRALFSMGIPVNGKNLFPSNISGLPTWYFIRLSKDGYTARRDTTEILVAFNPQTADEDLAALPAGGVCIHPNDMKFRARREDVVYYDLPVKDMVKASGADPKLRDYIANMVYVGGLAEILGIELEELKQAIAVQFKGRQKAIDLNYGVIEAAAQWTHEHHAKTDPYRAERMDKTHGLIMIDGNTAAALGTIYGGVQVVAWYPITPSTSLVDGLNDYLPQLRTGPDGKATYAVLQAEDELAAAGMIFGAGWAGCRSMTATAGPGLSLMTEFVGLAYFAECPGVIWDITRMGPSTGLPTRTSQGDVLMAYFLGHGDVRNVCLLPTSMAEIFEFGWRALDLSERLQTPVFVLSDLDLGMNLWMSEPFQYPDQPLDRGKVLSAEDLDKIENWGRYVDVDGDAIGWRTLPGNPNPKGAYFARGTGHNPMAVYSERPEDWEGNLMRLARKHETARGLVPRPVIDLKPGAKVGLIAYGSTDPVIVETRDRLRSTGIETSYLRVRALPMNDEVRDFVAQHDRVYVVESNFDGQMAALVQLHVPEHAAQVRSVAHCDGLPLTTKLVTDAILEKER